jgi:oligosaccharide repeat unit polymerase
MVSVIFLFLALVFYFFIYVKSKDIFQPLGIGILLWFLAGALANYDGFFDNSLQVTLTAQTNLCITLSGLFFSLPFLMSGRFNPDQFTQQRILYTKSYSIFFNLILLGTIIAFITRFYSVLLAPPLFYGVTNDLKNSVPDAIPGLNYADLFTPYAALMCVIELKFFHHVSRLRRKLLLSYIFFAVGSAIIYKVSRGEFLIFALGFVYLSVITKQSSVGFKKIAMFSVLITLFLYVGALRISDESRASTQFGSGAFNIILSQIYTYVAMNFQNLNALVDSNSQPTYIWGSLKFLLKFFFLNGYDTNTFGLSDNTVGFFNAKTYIYYFYNDLGYAGIILYPLVIGLVVQSIYNKSCKDIKYFALNSSLMKAIVFMFFGNYFFGEMVLLFPYLLIWILISFAKTVRINTI